MNEKLIQIAYRMERQAERMLKKAKQLREMAGQKQGGPATFGELFGALVEQWEKDGSVKKSIH